MDKKERNYRLMISGAAVALVILFILMEPRAEVKDTAGMLAAVVAVSAALWLFRFPLGIYASAMIFVVLAAAGSILLLYEKMPGYDRVVHYISGVILANIGFVGGKRLFQERGIGQDPLLLIMFSVFFSGMCAGLWEIFEFSADVFLHLNVQHGNSDTMGDIVSGFLGAVTFAVYQTVRGGCRNARGK